MSREIAPEVKVKAISFCRRNRLQIQIQMYKDERSRRTGDTDNENPPRKSRAMTACPKSKSNMAELNVLALCFACSFAAAIVEIFQYDIVCIEVCRRENSRNWDGEAEREREEKKRAGHAHKFICLLLSSEFRFRFRYLLRCVPSSPSTLTTSFSSCWRISETLCILDLSISFQLRFDGLNTGILEIQKKKIRGQNIFSVCRCFEY